MATISAGTSRTFTASANGATFTVSINGGSIAVISGGASDQIGPIATRKTYGPFAIGQTLTVASQFGDVLVDFGDATPQDSLAVNLYDQTTGRWLGVIDKAGNEQRVPSSSADPYGAPIQLTKLQAALLRVLTGAGQAFIGVIGDSTTVGAGAGTGGKGLLAARAGSPTSQLASRLNAIGIPASDDSWFGEHLIEAYQSVTLAQYETRVTVAGSAAYYPDGTFQSLGGIPYRLNSAGKSISFTPTNQTDTAKFFFFNNLAGTVDCSFAGGGSLGTVTGTGASSIGYSIKTYTKGAGAFAISWSSGNSAVIGAICYDSTTPRVNVLNLGCYGDKLTATNGYANNPNYWRGGAALSVLGLDAVIVDMTINSANQDGAAGVSAYKAALIKVCQDVVTAGADLILATPHVINTTAQTDGTVGLYLQAIREVAASFNAPVIDMQAAISSPSALASLYFDTLHLTTAGYRSKANWSAKLISSVAGV